MSHSVAIAVLCIAVAGVGAQWVAWRLRLPAIVLLFAVGLIVGPGLRILEPAVTFGPALRPIVGLAVAIVVFEGGLALDIRELRAAGEGVLRLTMVALPISFLLASGAAYVCAGMARGLALLFGAITVVTGPTVVLPLLRNTRLERRASSFLKWEAIVNDPIGALLAAIVLAVMLAGNQEGSGPLAGELLMGLIVSVGLGVGAAFLVRWMVSRDQLPETLKTPLLLALALGIYVLSNLVMDEAGLAAATIFGIALANLHIAGIQELTRFKESLVVLIVSALFVVLTASLDRSLFTQLSWPILFLTLAMLFVVRPAAILLATARSGLTWQERALASWIAPRGIVAAAVAGVASTKLAAAGHQEGALVMPAVFALIAATMILHGFSLAPLARRLGLTLGDRPGLAILGATPWSTDLAAVLTQAGTPVLVVDSYPGALDAARGQRIPVLQVEILSAHGEDELAGRRIDYLFAATKNDVYNSMVCAKLAPQLGRARVFQMAPSSDDFDDWISLSREWRGQVLGVPPLEFATARRRFREGWRFVLRDAPESGEASSSGAALDESTDTDRDENAEVAILIIRRNGDLAFASREAPNLIAAAGDRTLLLADPAVVRSTAGMEPAEVLA
jgi:NhaP-type Na+/H+ or K+/H+ antiporter